MKKSFSITIKDIILVAAIIFLIFWKGGNPFEEVKETRTETETVDIKTTIDEAINDALQKQKPETKPFIVYQDRVVRVGKDQNLTQEQQDNVKQLNVYKDTTQLKNARIYSEIATDGIVYSNKVTAEVDEKTVTKTIEVEKVRYASGIFVTGAGYVNPQLQVQGVQLGLDFIVKNDYGIGVFADYNLVTEDIGIGLRFSKKIF